MITDKNQLWRIKQNLELYLKSTIKNFAIILKKDSKLMKFLSYLLFFNKGFMTYYWTSFYPKIYSTYEVYLTDDVYNIKRYISVICHEGFAHLLDRKKYGYLFNIAYLFPQWLAIFAVLAFISPLFLCFLMFLTPIPSLGRFWIEDRGFKVSIYTYYKLFGECRDLKGIVDNFVGKGYYFMFPFRNFLMKRYTNFYYDVVNNRNMPDYIKRLEEFFDE